MLEVDPIFFYFTKIFALFNLFRYFKITIFELCFVKSEYSEDIGDILATILNSRKSFFHASEIFQFLRVS